MFSFVSYRTSQYKLHYYETPTNIKFVMLTDIKSPSMRIALQQIYINLFVEYGVYIISFNSAKDMAGLDLTQLLPQWLRTRCHRLSIPAAWG